MLHQFCILLWHVAFPTVHTPIYQFLFHTCPLWRSVPMGHSSLTWDHILSERMMSLFLFSCSPRLRRRCFMNSHTAVLLPHLLFYFRCCSCRLAKMVTWQLDIVPAQWSSREKVTCHVTSLWQSACAQIQNNHCCCLGTSVFSCYLNSSTLKEYLLEWL